MVDNYQNYWKKLIRYPYEEHYPFQVKELSVSYLDIRNLFVILRQIVKQKVNAYSLDLDNNSISEIQNKLKSLKSGGLSIELKDLLKKLSEKMYRKGGQNYKMFRYEDSKPYHKECGNFLPSEIKRACFNCHKVIVPQKIYSKEEYKIKYQTGFLERLTCPECRKQFTKKDINCPSCNPDDLPLDLLKRRFADANPNKAYIFPDNRKNLCWSNPKIIFNEQFFNSILKGIELEQDVYSKLIERGIPPTEILVSTRVKTSVNTDYGIEIDILFIDHLKGKIKGYQEALWAIEVKNWEKKIDIDTVLKFYEEVRPITKHLMFISPSGYDDNVQHKLSNEIRLLTSIDDL